MATEKEFTLEELAKNDGKDGRPAFVALKGVVYDASDSEHWKDGDHYAMHEAGKDLTEVIADAPHGEEALENLPKVGKLKT
jgi:predicted heme/steroid binding protein